MPYLHPHLRAADAQTIAKTQLVPLSEIPAREPWRGHKLTLRLLIDPAAEKLSLTVGEEDAGTLGRFVP